MMRQTDPLAPWRAWAQQKYGSEGPAAVAAALDAVVRVATSGGDPGAAAKAAEQAVSALRRGGQAMVAGGSAIVPMQPAPAAPPANRWTWPTPSAPAALPAKRWTWPLRRPAAAPPPYGGVADIARADPSQLQRLTAEALAQAEGSWRLSTLAFFGEPGFRGRYGFRDTPNEGPLAGPAKPVPALPRHRPWMITTPFLAMCSRVAVERGRLVLRYGVFSRRVDTFELNWIANITHTKTLLQRLLGEATVVITMDDGPFAHKTLLLPGVAPGRSVEMFCNRVRHASHMLRKTPVGGLKV